MLMEGQQEDGGTATTVKVSGACGQTNVDGCDLMTL